MMEDEGKMKERRADAGRDGWLYGGFECSADCTGDTGISS